MAVINESGVTGNYQGKPGVRLKYYELGANDSSAPLSLDGHAFVNVATRGTPAGTTSAFQVSYKHTEPTEAGDWVQAKDINGADITSNTAAGGHWLYAGQAPWGRWVNTGGDSGGTTATVATIYLDN